MSLKKSIQLVLLAIIINLVSIYTSIFAVGSLVLLILSVTIINNRDSDKLLRDKKIFSFIQVFMLCVFTFMFTVMGIQYLPIALHLANIYVSSFKFIFAVLGAIGLVIYYYLSFKLLNEAVNVLKQKKTLS